MCGPNTPCGEHEIIEGGHSLHLLCYTGEVISHYAYPAHTHTQLPQLLTQVVRVDVLYVTFQNLISYDWTRLRVIVIYCHDDPIYW